MYVVEEKETDPFKIYLIAVLILAVIEIVAQIIMIW